MSQLLKSSAGKYIWHSSKTQFFLHWGYICGVS